MSDRPNESPPTHPSFSLIEAIDVEGLRVATVRAALELDIFTLVAAGHDTEDALATACAAGRRGIHRLVAALRSLELLEERDGRLCNGPTADAYLRQGAIGDVRANYITWLRNRDHLVHAIIDDDFALAPHDETTWASYARGDLVRWPTKSETIASTFADRSIVVPAGGRVLDIGCGSGLIGFTAIRDVEAATVVSVDSAPVLEIAEVLARTMCVHERAEFVVGDIRVIDATNEFDLAIFVQVAQYLHDAALDDALRRIHAALRPGGRLVLATIIDDPGTPGHSMNWTSAIEMFLSSPGIALRSPDQLRAALVGAGFRGIEAHLPWSYTALR